MPSRSTHHRNTLKSHVTLGATVALLIAALACTGLTACGTASDPASQARSLSPQETAAYNKQRAELLELVSCARRHGVPLPEPTSDNKIKLHGVNMKSPRRKAALNACYQKVVKKAALAEQAEQAEREAGPPQLGEGPTAGRTQAGEPANEAFQQERERLTEVVRCARRHGIHLAEPDSHNNINTSGALKTQRQKKAMNACIREAVNKASTQQAGAR